MLRLIWKFFLDDAKRYQLGNVIAGRSRVIQAGRPGYLADLAGTRGNGFDNRIVLHRLPAFLLDQVPRLLKQICRCVKEIVPDVVLHRLPVIKLRHIQRDPPP